MTDRPVGALVLVGTPIGNLGDLSPRAVDALRTADVIAAEDTRRTRALLSHAGIRAGRRLRAVHARNEAAAAVRIVDEIRGGDRVAVVTDAGMPGVSDPGARLIAAALDAGAPVTVLPGPSAVETALVASGLVSERYQFVGYLPRGERALATFWDDVSRWTWPVVAFESPQRLPRTLRSLAAALPERRAAVCRELTKTFEEVVRGTAEELAARFAEPPKGEIVLVLGASEAVVDRAAGVDAVVELVGAGVPRRQAAAVVARLTGASRNALFEASL